MRRSFVSHASTLVFALSTGLLVDHPSPAAEPGAGEYAKVVSAESELGAYWRFDGDLKDQKGKADGRAEGGQPQFGEGPGAGKALVLSGGRFVTMGNTPGLDLEQTTVELWFQPNFPPGVKYNPAIIAKRAHGDHRLTRFSIHVQGDYSRVAVWNGQSVTWYRPPGLPSAGHTDGPPDGGLRKGQWYHLAVTCTEERMRLYLDGVPCEVADGHRREALVGGRFNFGRVNLPLSIGSSTPKGQELLDCCIDEVAIYRRALSEAEIARHVDAMGFKKRRLELAAAIRRRAERERKLRAQRDAQRKKRRAELLADPALMARGRPTVYRGEHLGAISVTLGGIGTGSIQIDGRAQRAVWQIFNNHRHAAVPHSFFAVRVKPYGREPVVRVLQTKPVGPFPAMKSLSFRGEYPFGWYEFEDHNLPVKVSMETFAPLIPLDVRGSSVPCAVFNIEVENTGAVAKNVSLLATQQNAVGYLGDKPIDGRRYAGYGGNISEILRCPEGLFRYAPVVIKFRDRTEYLGYGSAPTLKLLRQHTREHPLPKADGAALLHMTWNKPKDAAGSGDMVLMTTARKGVTGTASWANLKDLAAEFKTKGVLEGPRISEPSSSGETVDGALAVNFILRPRHKRVVSFVLTWHFPTGPHGAGEWGGAGNMYANWWPDALDVATHVQRDLAYLTRQTRLYHDSLYESNLPYWLLDRISSQVAVLRSQTCFWTKDGYFGGWEGCCRTRGCCHGNCNHVWHYAQAHARLFPAIARRMRRQEFRFQSDDGAIPHRQPKSHPAFDGQCGAVLNSYREYLISADRKWLDENWPSIKKAMDYLIATWDKDQDGVLAGPQWNTLDGALAGSSSWLGTLYLAALAAAEKMALLEDEPQTAKRYAQIRTSGSEKQDATLFNGEYYVQIPEEKPHEDYGTGCHIDQVLGQWWAHQLDLGWLYPPERVRSALGALMKYNFRGNFHGLRQLPRKFVADDDPGLQMITWPKGPRPAKVIRYGDEVMTGFEYSAAAAMVQAGLLREGLAVARAISIRYDGRLRTGLTPSDTASWGYSGNPFGDDECGKFYARAMSVWSMLLACQGLIYDGPAGLIGFKPVWKPEDHVSFFTAAEGWGLFRQHRQGNQQTERIELRHGKLRLKSLVFELPEGAKPTEVSAAVGGRRVVAMFTTSGREIRINLKEPVILDGDGPLEIHLRGCF